MPEQLVVERGAHPDQAFAVIDQQPDVELDAGQLGDRQALEPSRSVALATAIASIRSDLPRSRPPRRSRLSDEVCVVVVMRPRCQGAVPA